ncbi:MAG: lamin tail domain-containing protein, partial [Bacteroidota bacterium]
NNGIGNSVYFEQDATNSRIFTFSFSNDFIVGQENILTILNITDDCQNTQLSQELLFTYYEANQFDVVINEIMADPNPVIGLPEYEYLELYNRSDFDITLTNWQLKIGTKTQIFSVASIASKSYLIVSSSGGISELQEYGEIIDVIGSTDLTNSGASICLIDQYGKQIHSVTYSSTWHENSYKADGGWSLEQIDYNNPCGGVDNWLSSTDSKGGTPGLQNSVYNVNNDIDTPGLIRAIVIDTNTIKIFFDESLDTTTVFNPSRFIADNGLGNPLIINPVEYFYNSIILTFSNNLVNGIIYTLNITDSIADCSGNIISDIQSCRFAIPDSCETSDLVINEILFNPVGEVVDFVEIYNRSDKVFDLNDLFVASRKENLLVSDPYQWELYPVNTIDEEGYLVFPGEYYILSENSQIIIDQYYTTNEKGFIEIDDLPSLNDDDGIIIIADKWLNIIDEFHYSTEMHFSLINDIEGISLERINFDNPTQDAFNWHSAAESVGNATPAYINSQYNESESSIGEVILDPEIFSPDNDGYNDFLTIAYKFEKTGLVGNIVVYDAKGRIVRKLMQNELLAVDGSITWDGINDYNTKANIGIYLIYFEIYDLEGNVEKFRKICVLATKLND